MLKQMKEHFSLKATKDWWGGQALEEKDRTAVWNTVYKLVTRLGRTPP